MTSSRFHQNRADFQPILRRSKIFVSRVEGGRDLSRPKRTGGAMVSIDQQSSRLVWEGHENAWAKVVWHMVDMRIEDQVDSSH